MKNLKRNIALFIATLLSSLMLIVPATVTYAQDCPPGSSNSVCSACEGLALTGGDCNSGGSNNLNDTIKLIINVLSFVIGVVAVIMIMVGGLKYITSGGDSGNISSAKNTILYAIIGLVIVALAQVIVRFVLTKVPK